MWEHEHKRYTDAEAVAAMGALADDNPLHHDRATEWGATEHTAIGDAAPHHARYADAEALAAAIAGGLSKVIWLDASVRVVYDTNRTVTLDWTNLDLTAQTSANAKFAILEVGTKYDAYTSGSANVYLRKNGTTPTYYPQVVQPGSNVGFWYRRTIIMGLDSGQVLEYKILVALTNQSDTLIDLLGYIE